MSRSRGIGRGDSKLPQSLPDCFSGLPQIENGSDQDTISGDGVEDSERSLRNDEPPDPFIEVDRARFREDPQDAERTIHPQIGSFTTLRIDLQQIRLCPLEEDQLESLHGR